MKAIISHDVDHITAFEHYVDLVIPKYIIRNSIELLNNRISYKEYLLRIKDIFDNKWQNIIKILLFDKEQGIPSTFFIGVAKGKGLCYSNENGSKWINNIIGAGFKVGVHGIDYNSYENMKNEYNKFFKISNINKFGIRMHYLRTNKDTLHYLNRIGYIYDSSIYELNNPYKIGNMWEFPLTIMDGYIFYENSKWQNISIENAKNKTKEIIDKANTLGLEYINILFHDRYFNNSFKEWEEWYIWLIYYLKNNKITFIDFESAIKELETK